jgi:hypothetical protein
VYILTLPRKVKSPTDRKVHLTLGGLVAQQNSQQSTPSTVEIGNTHGGVFFFLQFLDTKADEGRSGMATAKSEARLAVLVPGRRGRPTRVTGEKGNMGIRQLLGSGRSSVPTQLYKVTLRP